MLTPAQSLFVIVGSELTEFGSECGDCLVRLIDCAEILDIPVISAKYPEQLKNGVVQTRLKLRHLPPAIPIEPYAADWRETPLASAIHGSGRRQLLVGGLWLEEAVSLLAHHAISVGLDVYVCIDACLALCPDQAQVLQSRFIQHGIVVATTEQTIREWVALASSEKRTAAQCLLNNSASNS